MIPKALFGSVVGGTLGYGYHLLMHACKTGCPNDRYPMLPVVVLGLVGAALAVKWK